MADSLFVRRQAISRELTNLNAFLAVQKELAELRNRVERLDVIVVGDEG